MLITVIIGGSRGVPPPSSEKSKCCQNIVKIAHFVNGPSPLLENQKIVVEPLLKTNLNGGTPLEKFLDPPLCGVYFIKSIFGRTKYIV
jgi:hypothetical protein